MLKVIPSADRYTSDIGWLKARWHFSFSDYHDPENMNWGALRVFNDDIIQPAGGFGAHPHRDMEIVTYVLEGALEHQDNLGNTGVIHPGEVQVMSAGRGIVHAEYNHSKEHPVHLMQLWILPRARGRQPRWEQKQFSPSDRAGRLLPVVSDGSVPNTLSIDQSAGIYVSSLSAGQSVSHRSSPGRFGYLFLMSGRIELNGADLSAGDQGRLADEPSIRIVAKSDSELIFLDLPGL
jgi:quercetin 2,3-dioxygenase